MGFLIDRRDNPKQKSAVNRQRFLRRYREQIQRSVSENLKGRHITDNERGEKISIPGKDIGEPVFHHGPGGRVTHVVPGNEEYTQGDRIARPQGGGGGGGSQGSPDGEGMDEFVFQINQQEFLDVLFDNMELPNLTKRQLSGLEEFKRTRGGFASDGPPGNLSVVRSMRSATARRIALGAGRRTEMRELQQELADLPDTPENAERRQVIEARIEELREALSRIPFLDDVDIRYHRHYDEPIPHSKAVMFCLMDVSGSMDQATKDLAKRFYILLYLFLSRNYDRTEIVFIRHHTVAKEVDEEEFFNSRETGGTVVSSALDLMKSIVEARYSPTEWNIYGAQASDGDNWPDDAPRCLGLINELLPLCQYYAYVEITDSGDKPLWHTYAGLDKKWMDVFAMQHITGPADIYPVFHELFREAVRMTRKPLSTEADWTFDLLKDYEREIARIAGNFGLDTYPNQIEVISSEQMMDAYASSAMPINYHHWSFGKHFLGVQNSYKRGLMGLAYEIVFNSNPCIAYLMEENTLTMQALVIAHASYGHNAFFKGNYLFRTWTDAESIVDYMVFARNYIAECEQRHGVDAVEDILDACHALMNHGVDRYKRPYPLSLEEERLRREEREAIIQQQVNELWKTIPVPEDQGHEQARQRFPEEPQENILYFLEKNAPLLEPWQREIIRIVRKVSQYLYPQRQTKVMNEGWACFWHFHILHEMYREGLVTDGFMMEFLQYHTAVVYQPPFNSPYYNGINPYTLGYGMMQELRRVSEHPTDEDRRWFPDIAGTPWRETLDFAMRDFKDESFILQFLTPKLIRELRLFTVLDDADKDYLEVTAIHDDAGYQRVRESLSANYDLGNLEPYIQVYNVNVRGNRALTLRHDMHKGRPLERQSAEEVVKHLQYLWGFDVILESVMDGEVKSSIVHSELAAGSD